MRLVCQAVSQVRSRLPGRLFCRRIGVLTGLSLAALLTGFLLMRGIVTSGIWDPSDSAVADPGADLGIGNLTEIPVRPDPTTAPPLEACPPADYPPDSAGHAVCDENTRGKFDGVIAGLRIAPDSTGFGEHTVPCKEPAGRIADPDTIAGSSMDIFVRELPRGWSDALGTGFTAWECDGRVITSDRLLLVAPGVTVHIVKYLRPEAWVSISASAERISETRMGTHQVAVVAGIPGLESVDARVAFAVKTVDGYVVTEVIGNNATVSQLIQVASELLK